MSNSLILSWVPYLIWHPREVAIEQWSAWQWIVFHVWKQAIPYSLDTLFPHKVFGARMNVVTDTTSSASVRILVPEHLVSTIVMHSIVSWWWFRPDVSIYLPEMRRWKEIYVPVLWPGISCHNSDEISTLVQELWWKRDKVGIFSADKSISQVDARYYFKTDPKIVTWREWLMSEGNICTATVTAAVQSDVKATLENTSLPATIDFDALWPEHFSARAMWRLTSRPVYLWVRGAHMLKLFNGITPDNYFLVWPRSKIMHVINKMQPKYHEWYNEHAYHMLYADFPGELAALAASLHVDRFHAQFTMKNMRHHDRLDRLNNMHRKNTFLVESL